MKKDEVIGLAARTAHEVNRAYCVGLRDFSQRPWSEAPQWQRDSAREGARGILDGNGPEACHQSWFDEKARNGWTYGDVKDAEEKTHPCMVPFDELPLEQQAKDHLFYNTVRGVLARRGMLPEDE